MIPPLSLFRNVEISIVIVSFVGSVETRYSVMLSQACSGIGGQSSKLGYQMDSGEMEEQSKFDLMRWLLGYTRYRV